jgi:hypothetical protein
LIEFFFYHLAWHERAAVHDALCRLWELSVVNNFNQRARWRGREACFVSQHAVDCSLARVLLGRASCVADFALCTCGCSPCCCCVCQLAVAMEQKHPHRAMLLRGLLCNAGNCAPLRLLVCTALVAPAD